MSYFEGVPAYNEELIEQVARARGPLRLDGLLKAAHTGPEISIYEFGRGFGNQLSARYVVSPRLEFLRPVESFIPPMTHMNPLSLFAVTKLSDKFLPKWLSGKKGSEQTKRSETSSPPLST
jgi:hypothetical protein